jgi:hypothetical protein
MGKGRFISTMARQNPDVNFIGVEVIEEVLLDAVKRMNRAGGIPENLRLVWINASLLDELFAPGENFLDYFHPDKVYIRILTCHRTDETPFPHANFDTDWILVAEILLPFSFVKLRFQHNNRCILQQSLSCARLFSNSCHDSLLS